MRRTFARLTRLFNRVTVALVLGQLAAVIAITVTEASRKKHRKLRRFPVTPPEPIAFESNELTIYTYGEHVFDDMIEAIDFARNVSTSRPSSGRATTRASASWTP